MTSLSAPNQNRALLLGCVGVFLFALTIPMTRMAVGSLTAPQLDPAFVAMGRAAVAGGLSALYLWFTGARRPTRQEVGWLLLTALGVAFGWPLLLGLAVRRVDAIHASVVTGVLPLVTASVGALMLKQRPSIGFWLCSLAGLLLVMGFAWWRGATGLQWADGLLLGAAISTSIGYVIGARLSLKMAPEQVISWLLVLCLPVTVPMAVVLAPTQAIETSAWCGFAYVSTFSMWIGFFAWYRALALGGTLRVSQVQVIQPFISMLTAVPLLGERLDAMTLIFALAVIAVVWIGKRMPVDQRYRAGTTTTTKKS
jgi:drug/metabolite transporter (DMT)-like permease